MGENKESLKREDLEGIKNHYQKLLPKNTSNDLNKVVDKKIGKQEKKIKALKKEILSIKKDVYFNNVEHILYCR